MSFLQDMGTRRRLEVNADSGACTGFQAISEGDRSLTVSRNWRITFAIDEKEGEITDLDFEDYH